MANINYITMAAAAAMSLTAGSALAKKCPIVGAFTDSVGSSGRFTTQTKGTVTNTAICPKPYALTVTALSTKIIDVTGKSKDSSCGALSGDFTFNDGGCTSASGTVTISGFGSFADTITKTGNANPPPADTSTLTHGFK